MQAGIKPGTVRVQIGGRVLDADWFDVAPSTRADLGVAPARFKVPQSFTIDVDMTPYQSAALVAMVRQAQADMATRREAIVRELLGRWVSELEPAVAIDQASGAIIGLAVAGDPSGRIVVEVAP